jgi:hypothetical protein
MTKDAEQINTRCMGGEQRNVRYALACRDATNQSETFPRLKKLRAWLVTSRQAKAYRTLPLI